MEPGHKQFIELDKDEAQFVYLSCQLAIGNLYLDPRMLLISITALKTLLSIKSLEEQQKLIKNLQDKLREMPTIKEIINEYGNSSASQDNIL